MLPVDFASIGDQFGRIARQFDLSVVAQARSERPAVRAIADAMPLLGSAARIEVIIMANERGKNHEVDGADVGQHLARHELNVEITRISRAKGDVASALLAHAADSRADLIVMGSYGHSRLREFVLGGVTHSMLRSMAVPVLMSH